jgi:hypothetical protein
MLTERKLKLDVPVLLRSQVQELGSGTDAATASSASFMATC